jgi:hypothetical protein
LVLIEFRFTISSIVKLKYATSNKMVTLLISHQL